MVFQCTDEKCELCVLGGGRFSSKSLSPAHLHGSSPKNYKIVSRCCVTFVVEVVLVVVYKTADKYRLARRYRSADPGRTRHDVLFR